MSHALNPLRRLSSLTASLAAILALSSAPIAVTAAQDTPLIMPARTNAAIINPGLGTMIIVEITDAQSTRKGFANWAFDLDQIERRVVGTVNGETFTALRTGSPTVSPSAEEVIKLFSDKPTRKQAQDGQKDLRAQVREAEKAFWEKEHKYDGVVRGAFDGQYLAMVLPAKRAVLFYKDNGRDSEELFSFTNFSPVLYVTTAWNSTPDPAAIIKTLNLDEDEQKAIEGALASRADGAVAAAAPSEIWCSAIGGGAFVLVDSANQKIWTYEVKGNGIALTSIRSMAADLLMYDWHTLPSNQAALAAFAKGYGQQIRGLGIRQFDEPYVLALVRASAVGDSTKAGALQANIVSSSVVLNFTQQHKLLTYKYITGQGLSLTSVRDDTCDQGLLILARMIQERGLAQATFAEAARNPGKSPDDALRLLTYALSMDPSLHEAAEKNSNLKNALKNDWDGLMASATKADAEQKAKMDGIEQAAQAERERLAKKKQKK